MEQQMVIWSNYTHFLQNGNKDFSKYGIPITIHDRVKSKRHCQLIYKVYYQMNNSSSQQKRRYSIFKTDIFKDASPQKFAKVPYHFDFNHKTKYVFDHSKQAFSTICSPANKQRPSLKKNKIFDKKRSTSQQKSYTSSNEHTSRCASLCGQRNRNHSIFKTDRARFMSEQDQPSVKDVKQEQTVMRITKTQSQSENRQVNLAAIKNQQEKMDFYRQQLEKKLKQRQKQRISAIKQIQKVEAEVQNPPDLDIMKPQQFAKMIKEVRMAAKSKRNQIIYPIPRILSEVPINDFSIERSKDSKGGLIYRI